METKVCRYCSASFPITDTDMEFYEKVSPVFGEKRYSIPTPTLCPDCRQQRRLSFRNERKLYKRKCDATGQDMVSIYSPESLYTVYHQDYWWSDGWNPMDYGREFDLLRGGFEQMGELMGEVPRPALLNTESENSEYSQTCTSNKDCYMIFESSFNADSYFCYWVHYGTYVMDCSFCDRIQESYDCMDCKDCYKLYYSQSCSNCTNSFFLENCIGCEYCFGSINLRNKKYIFMNQQYTETEYSKLLIDYLSLRPRKQLQIFMKDIFRKSFHQNNQIIESENCSGDFIRNATNCHSSFYVFGGAENAKYMCNTGLQVENVMDGDAVGAEGGYIYESINTALKSYHDCFCFRAWGVNNSYYINECDSSSHLFLCTGLRNKSYCILNKQCTREEYESLVPKIIEHMMKTGEWGEFFPSSLSPFGYNETVAAEYYPLTRSEAIQDGIFNWSDYEAPFPKVEKVIPAVKLPDTIESIPDDILNWAIECEVTGRPFRIIKQELEFYRKHALPIPRRHPDQRHLDRMALRNPRRLYERVCDSNTCEENYKKKGIYKEEEFGSNMRSGREGKRMITTYAPEREEIVYCEVCYEREVG